jgi:hypothetical protein
MSRFPSGLKKCLISIGLFFLSTATLKAQNYFFAEDSLLSLLKTKYASLSPDRILVASELLSRHLPEDPIFDSLRYMLIEEAENSRNRTLIAITYDQLAYTFLNYYQIRDYSEIGKMYADKCLQVASESGLERYKVSSFFRFARYYLNTSQYQRALDYNNQAISLASAVGSDSLLCLAYSSIANTWDDLANKLSQFQALLNERSFAEKSKNHFFILRSYFDIGGFYESVDDYEKAKDFYTQSLQKAKEWGDTYNIFHSLRGLGRSHLAQKNERLGISYYTKAINYGDSLHIENAKLQIYLDLLNYYFNASSPSKGIAYMNSHPQLMEFIRKIGLAYQVNKLYAALESSRNKNDSALYYLRVALPFEYAQKGNFNEKFEFTYQMARVYRDMGKYLQQRDALLLAGKFADSAQNIYNIRDISLLLDSVYYRLGDFKSSQDYLVRYNVFRDSIETLSKQKDLLNIEIENANKRSLEEKAQEQEATRIRNNLEYLGITAVIATVFIVLVLLGVFKISPAVIKGLGFFAFIFLFEFIVLLLDSQIHEITHGEPWKVLGIKIFIIALLLPLHHWLEEKMLHYLTFKAHMIKSRLFAKKG